jgi:hypothetical protein
MAAPGDASVVFGDVDVSELVNALPCSVVLIT